MIAVNDITIIESSRFIATGTSISESGENTKSLTLKSSISKLKLLATLAEASPKAFDIDWLTESIDSFEKIISSIKS